MSNKYSQIAKILRVPESVLENLDAKMSALTGQTGVLESVAQENDDLVNRILTELSLTRDAYAEDVYDALVKNLIHIDGHLYETLDKPDLAKMSMVCGRLCEAAFQAYTPPKGLFIKKEKAIELLDQNPPQNLLEYFGYSTARELVEKESFESVMSALRFTQTTEWMHSYFDTAYGQLKPDDFEEREVVIKVLEDKWLDVADKFLEKKYHNVSHLKEYGIIFVIPLTIDTPGETSRLYTLLLHYLHEVPFYSGLFRKFINEPDFVSRLQSLLRGDVVDVSKLKIENSKFDSENNWLVIQRYLAKDDPNDIRLTTPHVNPEAEHWFRVGMDLTRVGRMIKTSKTEHLGISYWSGLDFVGDYFKTKSGGEKLVSMDLIDLVMSLVKKGDIKYLYHQEESLWNKIFAEYLGRERMNQLIEENIIKGYIQL